MACPATRIGEGSPTTLSYCPLEEPLSIHVNGHRIAVLMRLPGHEKGLAVGFCISEGLVSDFQAIEIVRHCGQGLPGPTAVTEGNEESRNRIEIQVRPDSLNWDARLEVTRLIRSGCGAATPTDLEDIGLSPVTSDLSISVEQLLRFKRLLWKSQDVHHTAGGVHGTAIFDTQGNLIVAREDIGRHNAIDKVLGYCLLRDISLSDKILVSTGRASYEMVTKAIRLGISIVATISACTSLAVELANEYYIAARTE